MFRRKMNYGGAWYPKSPAECERSILSYWDSPPPPGGGEASHGVVPHAGWMFSGRVAARVFQALPDRPGMELVVVLGGHLGHDDPVVAMVEGSWETPFGDLPIHGGFRGKLETLPGVIFEDERNFFPDNSTELQFPFVKFKYPHAELLPLRVPPGDVSLRLGRMLAEYLASSPRQSVVIASTDLTHYGPNYGFEPAGQGEPALRWVREENDRAYIEAVASGDSARILASARERRNACSAGAVAALNEIAQPQSARFRTLEYATSSDVKPNDTLNFVGYMGGVFSREAPAEAR